MTKSKSVSAVIVIIVSSLLLIRAVPQALNWPFSMQLGNVQIYSESKLDPNIGQIIVSARSLQSRSKVAADAADQRIFLTNGGWRWKLLALRAMGAFAISIPGTNDIVVNRSDIAKNTALTGRAVGGVRPLDRVLAHEMAHKILRDRLGFLGVLLKPDWLVEGFCDYVADNSSLTGDQVAALRRTGSSHPALPYYEGRMKVQAMVEQQNMSIDQMFAAH